MAVEISVVIPVYNANPCLEELVTRLESSLDQLDRPNEIILLDDASEDGSYAELERLRGLHPRIAVGRNEHNLGQHSTILRGLSMAKGRLSVIMDCDLQDAPELIPELLRNLESSRADAVIVRYSNYANGFVRYVMSRGHSVLRRVRGMSNNDSRLAVFRVFGPELKLHLLRTYAKGYLLRDIFDPVDWKIAYHDSNRARRYAGRSSYTVVKLIRTALGRR